MPSVLCPKVSYCTLPVDSEFPHDTAVPVSGYNTIGMMDGTNGNWRPATCRRTSVILCPRYLTNLICPAKPQEPPPRPKEASADKHEISKSGVGKVIRIHTAGQITLKAFVLIHKKCSTSSTNGANRLACGSAASEKATGLSFD